MSTEKKCKMHEPILPVDHVKSSKWVLHGKEVEAINYYTNLRHIYCGICGKKLRARWWILAE